ncbi:copper amine oxidase N-terminal domain-containing protein [Paenibacillus sp. N1-5-1-14]|uniref:copper amine oxidase N-terminal domain-containing protein n=1 Tax=Paenibacillus radicibacter TaxID=2972488 RepID=UPI002158A9D8|nr:copper amine oxidase N-terminal domain-containing protein [Paenibacillus radicibacter]MCR8642676.1 copper amine oxidase N-terminal domain-containing protein [Paenibacillus radicibacter]
MKKKSKVLLAASLAAAVSIVPVAASASSIADKVEAFLNSKLEISLNGAKQSLAPLTYDGKTYLPLRDLADKMGFGVEWNEEKQSINLTKAQADLSLSTSGIMTSLTKNEGHYTAEITGQGLGEKGLNNVKLTVDASTEIIDLVNGKALKLEDLHEGYKVTAFYGERLTKSLPPVGHASKLFVTKQTVPVHGTIDKTAHPMDTFIFQVYVNGLGDKEVGNDMILTVDSYTRIMTADGTPVDANDLKDGMKISGYYGPAVMLSLPGMSTADTLIVELPAK